MIRDTVPERIIIDQRFRGPPESGNGGYVAGVVAGLLGGEVEVTLRRPPPLNLPLTVERADGRLLVRDGDDLIAEAVPATFDIEVPDPVTPADAEGASRGYPGFSVHPFPTCFVCGPQRAEGDGLRVFAGPVAGRDVIAAPWTPHPSLAQEDGILGTEFVWASLDCPGGWSLTGHAPGRLSVVGRLAVKIVRRVRAGDPHVVVAWPLGVDGRKMYAGTALFSAAGELCAAARATWIKLSP